METTEKKFDINNFCKDRLFNSRYDITTPWRKDEKVYATDGNILFISLASDFPEIQLSDKKPNIESLGIDNIKNYTPITKEEIEEILISHPPEIETIYEMEKCSLCKGSSFIEEKCNECDNSYEKICRKCQGEGVTRTTNIIRREIKPTTTPFKNTLIDWRYLKLIKDSMQALGGEWQVSETKPLDKVVFKNEATTVTIAVMPMTAAEIRKLIESLG